MTLQKLMYLTFHNYGVIRSSLIADNNIECEKVGDGNLDVAHHPGSSEELKEWGNELKSILVLILNGFPKKNLMKLDINQQNNLVQFLQKLALQ